MSAVDTPDYQLGVVSAQVLLASASAFATSVTVGIPPNAETLIVASPIAIGEKQISCVGVTTGIEYAGSSVNNAPFMGGANTWFFDVSSPVDAQVTVSFPFALGAKWYVYADAGVHIVADLSKLTSQESILYAIPTIPGIEPGDHPPVELLVGNYYNTVSGVIVAAPGAGFRIRLFAASMSTPAAGFQGIIQDDTSGAWYLSCTGTGNATMPIPAQGVPLSTNAALGFRILVGSGTMTCEVLYTVEAI